MTTPPSASNTKKQDIVTPQALWQFYLDNGLYSLWRKVIAYPGGLLRNHLIARKLGVRKITMSPKPCLRGLSSVSMGEGFCAGEGFWLEAVRTNNDQVFHPQILFGNNVRVSNNVHIAATNYIEIGDGVLMGSKVIITDHNHGRYSYEHSSPDIPPCSRPLDSDRSVVIGRNVWLGDGVVVTPGSCVGEGTVIAANSVVHGNIPPFVVAAGAPARILKTFDFTSREWVKAEYTLPRH